MELTKNNVSVFKLDGIAVVYTQVNGTMTFTCVPDDKVADIKESRLYKSCLKTDDKHHFEPMVQVSRIHDKSQRDFTVGATMLDRTTAYALKFYDCKFSESDDERRIDTYFKTDDGLHVKHTVAQKKGYKAAEMYVEIENKGDDTVIEYAPTFVINSITPLSENNNPEKLVLHRLHSNWSGEGRKESVPLSNYNFENSWSTLGARLERFGTLGSMPARGYIPFIGIEDIENGVTWAVQVEVPSSWQIEAMHRYQDLTIAGGQADYLYGHWRKNLKKGEVFRTHKAYFTVVNGNLDNACAALTRYHDTIYKMPESEKSLPVIYNEYLTSWGNPTMENVRPQLKVAKSLGAEYFVLDAGWFCYNNCDSLGEWEACDYKFPNGLIEFSEEARKEGYKAAGLWYEFESVTSNSSLMKKQDWLIKQDGIVLDRGGRLFLDFRIAEVNDYVTKKVIDALNANKLNYIKIDYNENIGYGVSGAESEAEGLRQHIEKVIEFYKKLRAEVPGLVMEVCSSGGMRHEPLFSTLGSMVSFSDAHENPSGAVIAMELQRVMQPRTLQIWASILPKHDLDEVYFTMVKAMLGRVCLAGKITEIDQEKYAVVKQGVEFYSKLKSTIKDGETLLIDTDEVKSLLNPVGAIRLVRKSADCKKLLCYAMCFGGGKIAEFDVNGYKIADAYGNVKGVLSGGKLTVDFGDKNLAACITVLEKI